MPDPTPADPHPGSPAAPAGDLPTAPAGDLPTAPAGDLHPAPAAARSSRPTHPSRSRSARVLAVLLLVEVLGAAVLGAAAAGALGLDWGLRGDGGEAASDRAVVLGLGLVLALLALGLAAAITGLGAVLGAGERRRRDAVAVATAVQVPLVVGAAAAGAPAAAAVAVLALGLGVRTMVVAARAEPGPERAVRRVVPRVAGQLAGAGALVLSAVVVPVTAARLLGVDAVTPFAQAVALTPLVGATGALALLLAVLAAVLRPPDSAPAARRPGRGAGRGAARGAGGRPGRGAVLVRGWAPVAVLAVVVALHAAWLAPRWAEGPAGAGAPASGGAVLVVASLNAELGGADPASVVRTVTEHDVDVLVVVELTPGLVDALGAAGLDEVLPERDLLPGGGPSGSGTWSRLPLTSLPAVDGTTNATPRAAVQVADGVRVDVVAAHPYPPIPGGVSAWTSDLQLVADAAAGVGTDPTGADPTGADPTGADPTGADPTEAAPAGTVVLGDFNATRDHAGFRDLLAGAGLRDAADVLGRGWAPTWPVRDDLPRFLELDHVLVSDAVAVDALERVTVPGTDHQGLVATLRVG